METIVEDFGLPGTELHLWEQFFTPAESDRYFRVLLALAAAYAQNI